MQAHQLAFTNDVGSTGKGRESMEVSSGTGSQEHATNDRTGTADCTCIDCCFQDPRPKIHASETLGAKRLCCRFSGCNKMTAAYSRVHYRLPKIIFLPSDHEKGHYSHEGKYHCREEHCDTATKGWSDLLRHTRNKHCKKSKTFPCTHIGCSRGGENGFPRKDKLKDHINSVHKGPTSGSSRGSVQQRIAPKPQGSA